MTQKEQTRQISFIQAINEALRQELERDPNVIIMGEDIGGGGEREDLLYDLEASSAKLESLDLVDAKTLAEFIRNEHPQTIALILAHLDAVKKGDNLFIMEVMKTEVHHDSPVDGTVIKVNVVNDQEGIDPGTVAIIIE